MRKTFYVASITVLVLLMISFSFVHTTETLRADPVPHCKVYEFSVKADSTYYQVDCGDHVKIKRIVETE